MGSSSAMCDWRASLARCATQFVQVQTMLFGMLRSHTLHACSRACSLPAAPHAAASSPSLQRTLAVELQRLSIQFRKQQKGYLNRLRSKDGGAGAGGSSFDLLGEAQQGRQQQDDYDPGFSDMQVLSLCCASVRCLRWRWVGAASPASAT